MCLTGVVLIRDKSKCKDAKQIYLKADFGRESTDRNSASSTGSTGEDGPEKDLLLEAETVEIASEWLVTLNAHIHYSSSPNFRPNVVATASTGDSRTPICSSPC